MKKLVVVLLVFALAFCTACGQKAPSQPPADSLMQAATFSVDEGKVTFFRMESVSTDYKTGYTYTHTGDEVSFSSKEGDWAKSKLTFAQMQKAMDCIAVYSSDPGFAFPSPHRACTFYPESRWYAVADQDAGEFQWNFVYSVGENTLRPLEGKYTGTRDLGVIFFNNTDASGNIADGSNQGKSCYIFLDK